MWAPTAQWVWAGWSSTLATSRLFNVHACSRIRQRTGPASNSIFKAMHHLAPRRPFVCLLFTICSPTVQHVAWGFAREMLKRVWNLWVSQLTKFLNQSSCHSVPFRGKVTVFLSQSRNKFRAIPKICWPAQCSTTPWANAKHPKVHEIFMSREIYGLTTTKKQPLQFRSAMILKEWILDCRNSWTQ